LEKVAKIKKEEEEALGEERKKEEQMRCPCIYIYI
jgi:hypothetical protein